MNKKYFKITSIKDNDSHEYWKNKSYLERLEALELLRQIMFGYDPNTARFQRIITVTKLKKN